MRPTDTVVRWGGEEFLIVLPRTRREFLSGFAERVRTRIESFEFPLPRGGTVRRTCSIGVASYPFFEDAAVDLTLDQLISLADMALYRAKEDGRNRVIHLRPGPARPADPGAIRDVLADLARAASAGYVVVHRPTPDPPLPKPASTR